MHALALVITFLHSVIFVFLLGLLTYILYLSSVRRILLICADLLTPLPVS